MKAIIYYKNKKKKKTKNQPSKSKIIIIFVFYEYNKCTSILNNGIYIYIPFIFINNNKKKSLIESKTKMMDERINE